MSKRTRLFRVNPEHNGQGRMNLSCINRWLLNGTKLERMSSGIKFLELHKLRMIQYITGGRFRIPVSMAWPLGGKMFDPNAGIFFRQWVQNPKEAGALSASSQSLASAMARLVDRGDYGTVIELGGGTGAITQALLQNGVSPDRLIVIEKNPSMADALLRRFSGVRIIRQDASRLGRIVREEQAFDIRTIISGLPMLLLGRRKQYAILRQAFGLLEPNGSLLQFTYGPSSPVCRQVLDRIGIKGKRMSFIWRNAPPATVWQFSRNNF